MVQRYFVSLFLFGYFLFRLGIVSAQNYYVSSVSGDDRNAGTSQSSAWATLDRVNRAISTLRPGASVWFERGGIFHGKLTIRAVSGATNEPITFGAYGVGEAPVISGAKQITKWEKMGENRWKAKISNPPRSIDVLFVNGRKLYPARYPKKGFLTVTNRYNRGLQDNTLRFPEGYWNGATVAFKTQDYYILRDVVAYSYSDGRIDMTQRKDDLPSVGFGYFFQNHINALDAIGEWVYDRREGTLILCTQDNPNEQLVEYSDFENAMEIDRSSEVIVEGICFQHYHEYAIFAQKGQRLIIRNNVFKNSSSGLLLVTSGNCIVSGNQIYDLEMRGIEINNVTDSRIADNTIRRIGVSLDGGQDRMAICTGILFGSWDKTPLNRNNEIIQNVIDSTGYIGICLGDVQRVLVKNNFVNHSMLCLADGGGIYTIGGDNDKSQINDNIVLNTMGNNEGTPYWGKGNLWRHGIYLDDGVSNSIIQGNTVANSGSGIFFHGSHGNQVQNNVLYDNAIANIVSQDVGKSDVFINNNLQNNYMYINGAPIYMMMEITKPDQFTVSNKIDDNYISAPFSRYFASLPGGKTLTRAAWSSSMDFDLHSHSEPVSYAASRAKSPDEFTILVYNPTLEESFIQLDNTYMSFDGVVHTGSILLQPFQSAILFRCNDRGGLSDVPIGPTDLCIGSSATYNISASLNLAEADTVIWHITPPAAGVISVLSGDKGSRIQVEWMSNYRYSPVQLRYSIQMNDGSNRVSEALTIHLNQDVGRPPTPVGPTEIIDITIPGVFTADNPSGAEIEWIIPPDVGILSPYDHYGNSVTVIWSAHLIGIYPITYRLRNSCGEWGATALPFYFSFPVAIPEGTGILCEGDRTRFTAPLYTDASDFTWVLKPANAGYLESNRNEVWVTLNKNAVGSDVVLYYKGLNNYSLPFQSPPLALTVNSRPATPKIPTGPNSISWDIPSSVYIADAGMNKYEWRILPATAGITTTTNNTATIDWGDDHDYAGQVQISYRVEEKNNVCGFSDDSPTLTVILLPKFPETDEEEPCCGSQSRFSIKSYMGASSYLWEITPPNAGSADSRTNTADVAWSQTFSGWARVACSVIDAAGQAYKSPQVSVFVRGLPPKPTRPSGSNAVYLNHPVQIYHATSAGNQYEWSVIPSQAADIQEPSNETASILWSVGYLGEALVSYRIQDKCGWSEMSDSLVVQVYSTDEIPGIFTPNGDGFNDTWDIPFMSQYPEAVIRIFNRAKKLMVELKGAQLPWNGCDHNGNLLESGYYLYQIELKKGGKVMAGYLTILR